MDFLLPLVCYETNYRNSQVFGLNYNNYNVLPLGLDGQRIIIFGGDESLAMRNLAPENSLYVLNLLNFEWYIPKISGNIPTSRMFHQANVIGKYMVISFGKYNIVIFYII